MSPLGHWEVSSLQKRVKAIQYCKWNWVLVQLGHDRVPLVVRLALPPVPGAGHYSISVDLAEMSLACTTMFDSSNVSRWLASPSSTVGFPVPLCLSATL